MSDIQDEAYSEAMDEIERLKAQIVRLKELLVRAANALADWCSALPEDQDVEDRKLIADLRKAGQ